MTEIRYKGMKDLPVTHLMGSGTAMCAGCGGLQAIKAFYDVLGPDTVFVNAAGCMTLLSVYPHTPFMGSWIYTSMASAPAGAQGIRDALDILIEKGRLEEKDNLSVVVLSGDGAATGMGLSATSSAINCGLDFYYLCYDNEGYGNTGHQSSAATPPGARTATAHGAEGHTARKKDLFSIWAAHDPAYVATITAAEPVDLARKVDKARSLAGAKLFIALSPCPTGWHYDPRHSVEVGRLAVKTGVWPLKEYAAGQVRHTRPPQPKGKRPPVEEYLVRQGRFAHLFRPRRNETLLARIQEDVDAYWDHAA